MSEALNTLIEGVLYGAIGVGAIWLFHQVWMEGLQWVRHTYIGMSHRRLLRVGEGFRRTNARPPTWATRGTEHLDILLKATRKKAGPQAVSQFLIGSGALGFLSGVFFFLAFHHGVVALGIGMVLVTVPYSWLRIRMVHLSIQNSYEIGTLIHTLVPEYRKQSGSMMHTLQATANTLAPGSIRRAVVRLADRLADHVAPEEARKALDAFAKELGTSWAVQLANDIEHAVVDGVDVEYSLALMHNEFMDIEDARKSLNLARLDSLLVAVMPFAMWPVMMFLFYVYLSRHILADQFDTPSGMEWFLITLICTFGSFLVGIIFYKPKQDI